MHWAYAFAISLVWIFTITQKLYTKLKDPQPPKTSFHISSVHEKNNQFLLSSIGIFSASSLLFGIWFKKTQLAIASEDILNHYPLSGFLVSALQSFLFFGVIWLLLILCCRLIDGENKNPSLNAFHSSLPFLVFLLPLLYIIYEICNI